MRMIRINSRKGVECQRADEHHRKDEEAARKAERAEFMRFPH